MTTWIIVADASRARIFERTGSSKDIHEKETLTHPASRLHEQELTSDLPGRAFDSEGAGRHAMGSKHEPKQNEADEFARQLAEHVDKARAENRFTKIIVVAAPAMLGDLRNRMTDETKKLVVNEIDKDLTQHTIEDIQQHLAAH
ncbi:MAG: host attachment protein [Thioalkalispiraceae bacterium]